jgi:hypothetical protein
MPIVMFRGMLEGDEDDADIFSQHDIRPNLAGFCSLLL